jgi:3-oxoacyl-[acyl-carrier-protein] synthase II
MIGHLITAAGVVELIACVLAIRDQMLPPTINLDVADPRCDLDYVPGKSRPARVNVALSNNLGFGGQNDALVVRRFEDANHAGIQ